MSNKAEQYKDTLRRYLPEAAVEFVFQYLTQTNTVRFIITRERHSKLGDYRWPNKERSYHQITINGNLNPYFFLWVLLHEMAHLDTWKTYRLTVQPHGHEWQSAYASLITQHRDIFPEEIQPLFSRYIRRIPLHNPTMREIEAKLRRYDPDYNPSDEPLLLKDIPLGSRFTIKGKEELVFILREKRRTRYLCTDAATNREYTVSGMAPVIILD